MIRQAAVASLAALGTAFALQAASAQTEVRSTIILVHGAFADGTGWQHAIPRLERDGYRVVAVQNPAWKSIPSWYLVTQRDQAINPDLERFYAKRIGATTSEVSAIHAVFVSQPTAVVRVIEQAAQSVVAAR